MDLALANEGAPFAVQPAEATILPVKGHLVRAVRAAADVARLSEMIRAGGSEAALAAARAPSPRPGQVLGAGAGLAVLGYPYP